MANVAVKTEEQFQERFETRVASCLDSLRVLGKSNNSDEYEIPDYVVERVNSMLTDRLEATIEQLNGNGGGAAVLGLFADPDEA